MLWRPVVRVGYSMYVHTHTVPAQGPVTRNLKGGRISWPTP